MSKADEKSKQYRDFREQCGIKDPVMLNEIEEACYEGYNQAEKDKELTWEDMMLIHKCIKDAMNFHLYKMMEGVEGQKVVYQEVLKRFKDYKDGSKG